jgi:hypothetical protein
MNLQQLLVIQGYGTATSGCDPEVAEAHGTKCGRPPGTDSGIEKLGTSPAGHEIRKSDPRAMKLIVEREDDNGRIYEIDPSDDPLRKYTKHNLVVAISNIMMENKDMVDYARKKFADTNTLPGGIVKHKGESVEDYISRQRGEGRYSIKDETKEQQIREDVKFKLLSGILYEEVNNLVRSWAQTSGDHKASALALQLAAQEEFHLKSTDPFLRLRSETKNYETLDDLGVSPERRAAELIQEEAQAIHEKQGAFNRAFLRAMYENTQEELQDQGITELVLHRGMSWSTAEQTPAWVKEQRPWLAAPRNLATQPMNSWAGSLDAAVPFSSGEHAGALVAMRVPRERILSTARTGFGALPEFEFVVLGNGNDEGMVRVEPSGAEPASMTHAKVPEHIPGVK